MELIKSHLFIRFKLNPPRILALGFMLLIIIGALLLNLPIASQNGESIGFINALFTSASAVCVTGLVVVNTATHWTLFGQTVIILLIQMGGLGIMTMATIVAMISGRKISLKERLVIKEQLNQETLSGLVKLTKYVIYLTLFIEGIGALFLSIKFIPQFGLIKGIWFSVFHAVSAFCNAGFDITGNSLMDYNNSVLVMLTVASLIVLGGIGFGVILDVVRNRKWRKLSLHSKLAISFTVFLIFFGTIIFYILESNNPLTMQEFTFKEKTLASLFASITPRTAGFNSIDVAGMNQSSTLLTIILMFIGGSPGSTAGGVKTVTMLVLIISTISIIKGERDVEVFKRRIPYETIFKSIAIIMIGIALVFFVTFILTLTEDQEFLNILFETTSAFGTVGLSRGITPELSNAGKLILTLTMYSGRVGPLTLAFAVGYKEEHKRFRYAEGNITVG
ncbi:Trk family potassium uptake protein [Soehngenia longivitae]|uniref:Trk family potassium uptake protein n=1 Tax=Soehngenia longivitae TaxID=2562294 RepID=A0A4Z0D5X3_9FIRM|nr:TrkH family potassium uptake protein [Soehngenia longivitae]TFZ40273.1 Trk family potassium uptake protein [Soehngenia longivitae]